MLQFPIVFPAGDEAVLEILDKTDVGAVSQTGIGIVGEDQILSLIHILMKLLKAAYGENISDAETLRARMYAKKEEIVQKDGFPQIPGVKEAIKRLHDEGFRLEVASSSAGYYIGRVLDALEIRQYFECYTSGEEVEHPKPAPDTFLRAMEKLNLKPEEDVYKRQFRVCVRQFSRFRLSEFQ